MYEKIYGASLEDEVESEVSGDYKRLLVLLLTVGQKVSFIQPFL